MNVRWQTKIMASFEKDDREVEIFKHFVAISELPIDISSIKKMREPAPDISCLDTSGTKLSFELVELLDEHFASMIDWSVRGKELMYALYDVLPTDKKSVLVAKYAHADIFFDLCDGATKTKFIQQIPLVFDELIQLPPEATGKIQTFNDKRVGRLIKQIWIIRSSVNGPMFNINSVTWMGDPTPDALSKKFRKSYVADCPVELVAYIEHNPMFPETVWRPKTIDLFESYREFGPFTRVWIVDLGTRKIKFVESRLTNGWSSESAANDLDNMSS